MPLTGATVEGKDEAARAIDSIATKASDAARIADEVARIGLDAARAAAPRRTGELASSLAVEVGTNEAELGTEVGYAEFPEFGTVHMAAWRFIGAGYEAMTARAEGIANDWLQGIVDDADRMA